MKQKILWEDWMGLERSVIVQAWIQMGLEKGLKKGLKAGRSEALRRALLAVLTSRFGEVGSKLEARIHRIDDASVLEKLIKRAAVVSSLRQLSRNLPS